jgi:hypothetical protein
MANLPITWLGVLFMILVPLGQLWARIFWLDGSLDQPWMLLPFFWIPPLSAVPAFASYFNYIKLGSGGEPPYDWYMLIPIIAKLLVGFFAADLVDNYGMVASFLLLLLQIGLTSLPHILRTLRGCKEKSFAFTGIQLLKAFIDGSIENGIADILPTILQFIPFVGSFISILGMIPILGDMTYELIWIIGYVASYVILNMVNQAVDFNKQICNLKSFDDIATTDKITVVVAWIASLFVMFTSE